MASLDVAAKFRPINTTKIIDYLFLIASAYAFSVLYPFFYVNLRDDRLDYAESQLLQYIIYKIIDDGVFHDHSSWRFSRQATQNTIRAGGGCPGDSGVNHLW
jgi:hypothetical protein